MFAEDPREERAARGVPDHLDPGSVRRGRSLGSEKAGASELGHEMIEQVLFFGAEWRRSGVAIHVSTKRGEQSLQLLRRVSAQNMNLLVADPQLHGAFHGDHGHAGTKGGPRDCPGGGQRVPI
jgi:hypothetical protein